MKRERYLASFFINFCLLGSTLRPQLNTKGGLIPVENRERNIQLIVRLNDEEKALFEKKRKLAKCKNMSLFIRKCVLEKEIYIVDLEPFADLQGLLYNATNNINQIAKHINSTGIIYRDDINDMKKQIENFSKELWQIHTLLLNKAKESD